MSFVEIVKRLYPITVSATAIPSMKELQLRFHQVPEPFTEPCHALWQTHEERMDMDRQMPEMHGERSARVKYFRDESTLSTQDILTWAWVEGWRPMTLIEMLAFAWQHQAECEEHDIRLVALGSYIVFEGERYVPSLGMPDEDPHALGLVRGETSWDDAYNAFLFTHHRGVEDHSRLYSHR